MNSVVHSNRYLEQMRSPATVTGSDGKVRLFYILAASFLIWFYSLSNDWAYLSIISVWIIFYRIYLGRELKFKDFGVRSSILRKIEIQDAALCKFEQIIDFAFKIAKIFVQRIYLFCVSKSILNLFLSIVVSKLKIKRRIVDINLSSKLLPTPLPACA
jgi:hypothetical protein